MREWGSGERMLYLVKFALGCWLLFVANAGHVFLGRHETVSSTIKEKEKEKKKKREEKKRGQNNDTHST